MDFPPPKKKVRFFDGHLFWWPTLHENNDSFNGKMTFEKDNTKSLMAGQAIRMVKDMECSQRTH